MRACPPGINPVAAGGYRPTCCHLGQNCPLHGTHSWAQAPTAPAHLPAHTASSPALLGSARHHAADEDQDEFAEHFRRVRPPNVLITTSYKVTGVMYKFVSELLEVSVRPPGVCGGVGVACENSGCG